MTLVREVTKMPTITLKELERSAPHMGEGHSQDQPSTHTHTPQSWALWKSYLKKSIIEKKKKSNVGDSANVEETFSGLMR